jgi:integrase
LRRGWLAIKPVTRHADTFRPLFELLVFAGLRIGEALGLRWCDIDLDGRTLRVEQQLGRDRRPKRLKTPPPNGRSYSPNPS